MDRVKSLFLDDNSANFRPLMRLAPLADSRYNDRFTRSSQDYTSAPSFPTYSITSTSGRTRRDSTSNSLASSASDAPSIHIAPPWVLYPPAAMTQMDYHYDLPCEFSELYGCTARFYPEDFENWIAHSRTHFVNTSPPPTAICIFCDDCRDGFSSWRERMIHIGGHYHYQTPHETMRPDFHVLEHLYRNRLLSGAEYDWAMSYTERARCDGMVEEGFQTPEMQDRDRVYARDVEKSHEYRHDSRRESRLIREDKGKSRKSRGHKSSHGSRVYQETRS